MKVSNSFAECVAKFSAVDFDFIETASFTIVQPMNDGAREHLEEHTDGTWQGDQLVCETRYAPELSASLCRDGFTVELPDGRVVTAADLRE